MKPTIITDKGLPKKADCSDCGEYRPVRWMLMSWGMDAACAACIVMRKLTLAQAK